MFTIKYLKIYLIFLLLFLFLAIGLAYAEELSEKLKGRILLQIESHGEAWYVNPDSQKRFYLGRPADAFAMMREQGLGVSNKDFASFNGVAPKRLAGKILLKVEANGEVYYVNPIDLKMIYLGRPADAFAVMREQGLGITNENLAKIKIDEKSSPIISEEATEIVKEIEEKPDEEVVVETPEEIVTGTEEIIIDTPEESATTTEEVVIDLPAGQAGETAATSCVWLAEYFNNKSLFGSPLATSSVDEVNFNWGSGGPEGINKINNFSARFTANCYFAGGNYEFQTKFDDAIRVYLDNENFLQSWADNNTAKIINRERNIEKGNHEVKVEYYDAASNAVISVGWVMIN